MASIHVKDIIDNSWITVINNLENTKVTCYSSLRNKSLIIQDPEGETTMASAMWGNMNTYNGITIVITKGNYNFII